MLAEGEKLLGQGQPVEDVARHLEISESTWHRWQNQYGGMKADDAKELRDLRKENQRLKKIVADQALDIDMLKGAVPGKLLAPDCRRRPVRALQEQFGVSARKACKVVGQPRSTHRLEAPVPTDAELALRAFLRDFWRRHPRWGWRRAAAFAKKEGWRVNHKRIHLLWRDEGLRVPSRKKNRPLRGIGVPVGAFSPIRPNVIWGWTQPVDATSPLNRLREGPRLKT